MSITKVADLRESVRIVTDNAFIICRENVDISLHARKILYISIAQCKMKDKKFDEFTLTVNQFSNLMEVKPENIYAEAEDVTKELMSLILWTDKPNKRGFYSAHVFEYCEYTPDDGFKIKLSSDMKKLLLNLKGDFTEPLLKDFVKMNSKYSMKIWHMLQKEMKSKLPGITDIFYYDISMDDLRQLTGTEDKLKTMSNFKARVLDAAVKDIAENCGVNISYTDIKRGRGGKVVGFTFKVMNQIHVDLKDISPETLRKVEEIKEKQRTGELP